MEDIDDHLLSLKQTVCLELAGAQGNGALGVHGRLSARVVVSGEQISSLTEAPWLTLYSTTLDHCD